ncbi:class I SAM-dependent methyltransferase [Ramlibacter sp. G-1-2-2]|uniref:Class I SAM-dependent methyltransferase n=1 Tax=Ramlibacter agri TaxID=2728837 RepID=A0A848H3A4_9BURK|nr:class I SAM-dependent methyltransferase [Ramlibacter agri]NML42268.1 class I SAM-dependent methyltransferase [Ramlibacter agri]
MTDPTDPRNPVLAGYAADAKALIPRYEAVRSVDKLAPVAYLLPRKPSRVADIGAGTGVDAAWFAAQGHSVLAIEPTKELREAGRQLHPSANIVWLDDSLPALEKALSTDERFDLVLACGVWAHLSEEARGEALASMTRLLAPGGLLILSIRHGPSAPGRPTYPAPVEQVIAQASGLRLIFHGEADSVQAANRAAGVTWSWLAFRTAPAP